MREIKFRAWVEKTEDIAFDFAYAEANRRLPDPTGHGNYEDQGTWYYQNEELREDIFDKWIKDHGESERYKKHRFMTKDIKVNGIVQRGYGVEVLSVMQYTGCKDMNGTGIYEGDILKNESSHELVLCTEDSWGTKVVKKIGKGGWILGHQNKGLVIHAKYGEVIGNEHQNPELFDNKIKAEF